MDYMEDEQKQQLIQNERSQTLQLGNYQSYETQSNRSQSVGDSYSSLTSQRQKSLEQKKQTLENQAYDDFMKKTTFNEFKGYDPSKQADLKFAQRHKTANKIKKIDLVQSKSIDEKSFCQCCWLPVKGIPYKVTQKLEDLSDLGFGVVFYFRHLKFMCYLLIVSYLIYGFPAMIDIIRRQDDKN